MSVVIETTLGDVTVDLFTEERPQTCLNFLKLCKIKYYNLCLFHSVSSNFLAQTGDPTGKGDGGESIFGILKGEHHRLFQGEKLPKIKHDKTGLISMVSHGDGMFGSQFLITLSGDLTSLDQEHCVFGQVVEGVELLLKLNEAIADDQHRPYQDIRITHTVVLDDPFPDPEGLLVPPESPVPPNPKDVAYSRIPADEPLTENCSPEELDEMVQQREAAARAAILEMVGDIPDADIAPPENVLFVCKLNPVTSDHDLSIIFSRFGTVKSCEVIRDQISGDSLQYAFIEFEDRKACEDAYFKMDNVLIDDRRIHVDFSQSVAKLKWKGKGRGVEQLGPPPPGGWGNRSRENSGHKYSDKKFIENRKKDIVSEQYNRRVRNGEDSKGESTIYYNNKKIKVEAKKDLKKKDQMKKRKSSSSSSSSESVSESTDTSSDSSESYDKKRSKRKSRRKVLVVLKTPSKNKIRKKSKKTRSKHKKNTSDSDSDSDDSDVSTKRKKEKRRRKNSSSDSSSDEVDRKKRKRKMSSSPEYQSRNRNKKRKKVQESSDSTSVEDYNSKKKSKNRKRKDSNYSSSDFEKSKGKKRKKEKLKSRKKKEGKKPKKKYQYDSDSSSSSD